MLETLSRTLYGELEVEFACGCKAKFCYEYSYYTLPNAKADIEESYNWKLLKPCTEAHTTSPEGNWDTVTFAEALEEASGDLQNLLTHHDRIKVPWTANRMNQNIFKDYYYENQDKLITELRQLNGNNRSTSEVERTPDAPTFRHICTVCRNIVNCDVGASITEDPEYDNISIDRIKQRFPHEARRIEDMVLHLVVSECPDFNP